MSEAYLRAFVAFLELHKDDLALYDGQISRWEIVSSWIGVHGRTFRNTGDNTMK